MTRSFSLRLWDNTAHVTRQLNLKIGQKQSAMLVNNGKISFEKILDEEPNKLEQIMGRAYPFGSQLHSAISALPLGIVLNIDVSHENDANGILRLSRTTSEYSCSLMDRKKAGAYMIVGCPESDQLYLCRYVNFAEITLPLEIHFTRKYPENLTNFESLSMVAACIFEQVTGLDTSTTNASKGRVAPTADSQRPEAGKRKRSTKNMVGKHGDGIGLSQEPADFDGTRERDERRTTRKNAIVRHSSTSLVKTSIHTDNTKIVGPRIELSDFNNSTSMMSRSSKQSNWIGDASTSLQAKQSHDIITLSYIKNATSPKLNFNGEPELARTEISLDKQVSPQRSILNEKMPDIGMEDILYKSDDDYTSIFGAFF